MAQESSELTIRFGVFVPSIDDQLRAQGFTADDDRLSRWQRAAADIAVAELGNPPALVSRRRLMAEITKGARRLADEG